jgi:hypothetical protein
LGFFGLAAGGLVEAERLLVVAEFGARECQESAGEGLPGSVAEAGSGGQRRALGGCRSW